MPDLPSQMTAVLMMAHGGPEMLSYREDVPLPKMAHSDVLIKVEAAAVNNTDINTRIGWYSKADQNAEDAAWTGKALAFPRIQGADVCGVIADVGEGGSKARIGERVLIEPSLQEAEGKMLENPWYFGSECDGGFAQYCVVASRHAHKVVSDLSSIELASFPCSYSTALNMLTRAAVHQNDRVLVTGASGGVGSAAVQLAKARGAEVFALTSASKQDMLRDLGADQSLDRKSDWVAHLGTNSIDVVIDLVGGSGWPQLLEMLKPTGRYAVSGAIAGPMVELDLRTLYLKDLRFFGCTVLDECVFSELVDHIEKGDIKPLVSQTFDLHEINAAQAAFEQKNHVGKIVLKV